MSSIEQVRDNVSYMEHFKPLDDGEKAVVEEARKAFNKIPWIPRTFCEYCIEGCSQKINIPKVLDAYNRKLIHDNLSQAQMFYQAAVMLDDFSGARGRGFRLHCMRQL